MTNNTDPVRALIAKWQAAPYGKGDHDYYVDGLRACARELEAALASAPPSGGQMRQPDGYAYRYPDGIRFNGGREVNGHQPTEAIPYYFNAPPSVPVGVDLPINDAVPPPTETRPGNLFLWNWTAMQQYGRACIAHALAQQPAAPSGEAVETPEDRFEQFIQAEIARSPYALRELGEYLADKLDEDKWPRANALLLQLATEYAPQQPAAPSGEAVAWLAADDTGRVIDAKAKEAGSLASATRAATEIYSIPLYAAPQQPAAVDEVSAWSKQQPACPGIYGIRGFNLCRPASEQFEAVVVVREYGGELVCNLHESTSEDDLESWAPICDLDPDFEWRAFVPGWEQRGGRADG